MVVNPCRMKTILKHGGRSRIIAFRSCPSWRMMLQPSSPTSSINSRPFACRYRTISSTLTGSSGASNGSKKESLQDILERVSRGELDPETAMARIDLHITAADKQNSASSTSTSNDDDDENDTLLQSFANLDYKRSERTGFPEAVFAEGKTSQQVAALLDNLAKNFTLRQQEHAKQEDNTAVPTAILATRVNPSMFQEISTMSLEHGELEYHEVARIVSMKPFSASKNDKSRVSTHDIAGDDGPNDDARGRRRRRRRRRIVVATAGTTDIPVAEEAAIVLEAAGCDVDRIYDAGVAGLHRIVKALPRLRHGSVGAVIVCAGMDGALPSVVGGLVSVPVIAVPTSIGYGASFGGVSALLTMLNSCAPGVGVVNIDNGFGAAVLAFKCLGRGGKEGGKQQQQQA